MTLAAVSRRGPPALLIALCVSSAHAQTAWDPHAVPYDSAPTWQLAAVTALNRHLPSDSGYWVLGPLDLSVDLPDTTDLVLTSLRILAPDLRGAVRITDRLWFPTGGVALEELQPSDTLPHQLPPGYPGRFLKGTIVGERALVQVFTVQQHRWLLWAQRAQVAGIQDSIGGTVGRYSRAVAEYLAAVDSGRAPATAPRASAYRLDPVFDFYAAPPDLVVRDQEGYRGLLTSHRSFTLEGMAEGVLGVVPGSEFIARLEEKADGVLFLNKEGEPLLQQRYEEYRRAGGSWNGRPLLDAGTISELAPGRYSYVVDRYGTLRVGPESGRVGDAAVGPGASTAILAHGDPVRVAGQLSVAAGPAGGRRVSEIDIDSGEYFFSNRVMSLYEDVEQRSDRYIAALGHALRALDLGRLPRDDILIRKF